MSVTVYTANLGGFENLRPPRSGCAGAQFVCYADEPVDAPAPWTVLPAYTPFPGDPARNVRAHKTLSHIFTGTPYSIWMDGNFVLAIDPQEAVDRWLRDSDIAVFPHPGRSCLYDEARQCLRENIGDGERIRKQIAYYQACGFPSKWGLFACGVILRRHTPRVVRLNEAWWAQVRDFCERDQISFPFVLHQHEVPVTLVEGDIYCNSWFVWKWHAWKSDHPDNLHFVERRKQAELRRIRVRELCPPRPGEEAPCAAWGFHVVILSRDAGNLVPCVKAVLANEPGLPRDRIIVVDDGARALAEPELPGIRWVEGARPFVFARNANLGIRAAGGSVILLNDDALLMTPGGFTGLSRAADENPAFGVISAVTNVASNPDQSPRDAGLRQTDQAAFVCTLIPRSTLDKVGLLDERYCLDYGVEDHDYCHRVGRAGLKIGVYDFCFVDHGCLTSSYRGDPRASRSFERNYGLFREKWGKG